LDISKCSPKQLGILQGWFALHVTFIFLLTYLAS
jgi:hypothetical protein